MFPFLLFTFTIQFCFLSSNAAYEYKEVEPNVYTFSSDGSDGAYVSLFIVTRVGVVAIEPVKTSHAEDLVKAIRCVTNKPIKYLFISHSHWDHSSGGKVFHDAGAKVVAHEDCRDYLKYNPGPETYVPDQIWQGSRKDYVFGDFKLELYHFGISHGKGMTVFVLPKQKMAYISDLGLPKQVFFLGMPDYNIQGLLHTLKEITKLDFKRAILTHQVLGKTGLDGGTKQDSIESYEYVRDLVDGVDDLIAKGVNVFSIPSILKLDKYKDWLNYNDWYPKNVERVMLDRHMGPWDPPQPSKRRKGKGRKIRKGKRRGYGKRNRGKGNRGKGKHHFHQKH